MSNLEILADRYQIVSELGRGGTSTVYLAQDTRLSDRLVAVKVFERALLSDPEMRNRLRAEAKVLAMISHPNIIRILDYSEFADQVFIVEDYLGGGSLADLLKRRGRLAIQEGVDIVSQVAAGLNYAHQRGLVHRDIKPSNILADDAGRFVLTDFGIAALVSDVKSTTFFLGTPAYMSPEHARGERVDARADIYSLALVLYEVLTSTLPFQADSPAALLYKQVYEPPPSPRQFNPAIPSALEAVILKALAKTPAERYGTADEFAYAAREAVELKGVVPQASAREIPAVPALTQTITTVVPSVKPSSLSIKERVRAWFGRLTGRPTATPLLTEPVRIEQQESERRVSALLEAETVFFTSVPPVVRLGAQAPSLAWLMIEEADKVTLWEYTLQSTSATIGRGTEAEIRLIDPRASRQHSEIRFEAGDFYIYDLGSSNGTLLNGERIQRSLLRDNDVISIGDARLTFRLSWQEWLTTIEAFLQDNEAVSADMLVNVPSIYRRQVLQRYAREHSDQALVFDPETDELRYERVDRVRTLREQWRRTADDDCDFSTTDVQDPRLAFVQSLCDYLGIGWKLKERDRKVVGYALDTSVAFHNTQLPVPLPLLCLAKNGFDEHMAQAIRQFLVRNYGGSSRIAVALSFEGGPEALAQASVQLQSQIKGAYAYDVIVISKEEVDRLIQAKDPLKRLRKLLLSHVDLKTVSPFIITGPVAPNIFFGREGILRTIIEHAHDRSFILVGGRRIGKSSILTRLHNVALPEAGFTTVFHDCSTTPSYDSFVLAPVRDWRPSPPVGGFQTMGSLLQVEIGNQPLVILLDEADKLIPSEQANGWCLFSALRALNNVGRARFVLAGERALQEALQDPGSPVFNLANEILIGRLEHDAVRELVTTPMRQLEIELQDEDSIVECIYDFTSGHPNVVQRLCHRLIVQLNEQGGRRLTLGDVNRVIEDPGFQSDDFLSTYWEAATSLERLVSLLMADDSSLHTLVGVRQALATRCHLQPKANEVNQALERLVKLRSLLKRSADGYEFAVQAFPRVVAGTMTLGDELEVLTEEYEERHE